MARFLGTRHGGSLVKLLETVEDFVRGAFAFLIESAFGFEAELRGEKFTIKEAFFGGWFLISDGCLSKEIFFDSSAFEARLVAFSLPLFLYGLSSYSFFGKQSCEFPICTWCNFLFVSMVAYDPHILFKDMNTIACYLS
ncbi:hypothetical protein M5689_004775 [Euphorbia peplus]|nr:hypothetical protein M5689_004775 [Euphorbia peplus]